MTHSINIAYLEQLKTENNVSLNDIANLSKVPVGTVKRIFAGTSESPNVSAVADIVACMNGSLDDALGIVHEHQNSSIKIEPQISKSEPFEKALQSSRESFQNAYNKACEAYREQIAEMKHINAMKDKWLLRMFIYSIGLTIIHAIVMITIRR